MTKFGKDRRGDELPAELARRETRLVKLRQAKKALEEQAARAAAEHAAELARRKGADEDTVAERAAQAAATAVPNPKAQVSGQIQSNTGQHPDQLLADAGYCSAENLDQAAEVSEQTGTESLIATGRREHDDPGSTPPRGRIPKVATAKQRMARKLTTKPGRAACARRKAIVEPVFGRMSILQNAKSAAAARPCRRPRRRAPARCLPRPSQAPRQDRRRRPRNPRRRLRTRSTGPQAAAKASEGTSDREQDVPPGPPPTPDATTSDGPPRALISRADLSDPRP